MKAARTIPYQLETGGTKEDLVNAATMGNRYGMFVGLMGVTR